MIKTKDGYAKVIGTTYQGSPNYLLQSNGGAWAVHTARNNEADKIVRTDTSGYLNVGWIDTISGNMNTATIDRVYCSNDSFVRYKTPANFFSTLDNSNDDISITVASQNRTLTVAYAKVAGELRSKGTKAPQTGRTQTLGDVYSYHLNASVSGGPTTYAAVIGFGRGTAGTVEIAGEWTSGRGVWVRALRDTTDNWYKWDKVLTQATYTSITDSRYYTKTQSDERFVNVTGDDMTGNLKFTNVTGLIQTSNTTSNYTTLLKWYNGDKASASGTYDAQIGRHNTGHDGKGAITILPYPTTTSPWDGSVGLYVGKNMLKLDGNVVLHSGNYTSYFGYIGKTKVQVSSADQALTGILSINGRLSIAAESDQTRLGFGGVHNVVFGEPGYAHRIYYLRPSYGSQGTTNTTLIIQNASAESSPIWTTTHSFDYNGTATHVGHTTAAGFKKKDSSDSYVLLGGGGHKKLSDIQAEYDGRYVNIPGDTMTGKLSISINSSSSQSLSLTNTTDGWTYMTMGNGTSGAKAAHLAWKTTADGAIPANAYHIRPGCSVSIAAFTSGAIYLASRLVIDSTGRCYPMSTNGRRAGMYGIYDSTKIGHIWSMGTSYMIPDDGANFGNLYGLAYKHTNNSTGGAMAGGHQAVWCENGTPKAAMGTNGVWADGGFYKSGSTSAHLLRGDGGQAAFNWDGQAGQPTWLWGGNSQHSYYVYNPSNFTVAKAYKADQLEAYTGSDFTGGNHYLRAIRYDSWHTRLYMGYYRDATLQNTVHVGYADNASYLTQGFSATYTNNWNCNTPDRVVYSDYGSAGRSISNAPSGWKYGTLLSLGHTNHEGLNGNLSMQLMWDVAHNTKDGGTLWFRGRDSINGWAKNWCKIITDQNYTGILDGRYFRQFGGVSTDFNFGDDNNNNGLYYLHTNYSQSNKNGISYGSLMNFSTSAASWQLISSNSSRLYYRNRWWSGGGGAWSSWYTLAFTSDIPTSLKNPYSLTLQTDGSTQTTYDGSSAKTFNVTVQNAGSGLLHNALTLTLANTTSDSGWSMINSSYNGFILKSIRTQGSAPNWIEGNYASGICFGGSDTKGVISAAYGSPAIRFAGGNGSKPVWWMRITGTNGTTYNLANMWTGTRYWANIAVSTSSNTGTSPTFSTAYTTNWFRSYGKTGWYSQDYGGGIYMTDSTYVRVYGSKLFYAASGYLAPYSGSSWITMATRTNCIVADQNNSASSAHALFRAKDSSGNAIAFGGLGGDIGFYGFTASRISNNTNGTDWSTVWNVSTGVITHNKEIYTAGYYHSSVKSNNYVLLAGGSYKTLADFAKGNAGSVHKGVYVSGGTVYDMTYYLYATVNSGSVGKLAYYSSNDSIASHSTSIGNEWTPVYLNSGAIAQCYYSFYGGYSQPIVLVAGTIYRSSNSSNYWYFTGVKHSAVEGMNTSISVNGGVASFTFRATNKQNLYFHAALVNHQASTEVPSYTSGDYSNVRSDGLYWFGSYATGQTIYVRACCTADKNNDSTQTRAGAWQTWSGAVTRFSVIIMGYATRY